MAQNRVLSTAFLLLGITCSGSSPAQESSRCGADGGVGGKTGFRIAALHFMDLSPSGWSLYVDTEGGVLLRVADQERKFRLKSQVLRDLQRTVKREDLWSLATAYGTPFATGTFRRIDVCDGLRTHSVTLNEDLAADPRKGELARALRLWALLRIFVSDKAVDSREADAVLLKSK